jgi:hypothetical protein
MDIVCNTPAASGLVRALLTSAPRPLVELEAELLMYAGQYLYHYRDETGRERWKPVTGAALRTAFSGQPIDSGWLPPGVVRAGEGPAGPFAVFWQPPAIHLLQMEVSAPSGSRTEALRLPLPGLVFLGVGTTYWCWATPQDEFSPAATAYQVPLPNVYPDGRICWGQNTPPPALPTTLAGVSALFLGSLFNGDLVGQKCKAFPNDVRGYLTILAERLPGREDQWALERTWDAEVLMVVRATHEGPRSFDALCAEHLGLEGTP